MRIQITATGFELTPSLKLFVEEKLGGLEKILKHWNENDSVIIRIEIAKKYKASSERRNFLCRSKYRFTEENHKDRRNRRRYA